jgi:isopenicillin-N N-acyltransferase-like protein
MGLPVVRLAGSPYEQGLEHGRALRERIARNVQVYFDRFQREVKPALDEVIHHATRAAA